MNDSAARFSYDPVLGQILVSVGKVEIGQHVHSAFRSMVADALGIHSSRARVLPVSTQFSPDDGLTAGSQSIQVTGASLRCAAISLRAVLLQEAAHCLESIVNDVDLDAHTLEFNVRGRHCSLFDLPTVKCAIAATIDDDFIVGAGVPGSTIAASIRGERTYIQDLILPGMIYARALRGRHINNIDLHGASIVSDGGFTALVADTELLLDYAWAHLDVEPGAGDTGCDGPVAQWIHKRHAQTQKTGDTSAIGNAICERAARPFLLHASIAPSCAIALFQHGVLKIWTHSQGIFPLRDTIAGQLGMSAENIIVRHVESAGCYGHNAADDAVMDAVLVSLQHEGSPVRVTWTRQDECQHAPLGAPMTVQVDAALGADGSISNWRQTIWSGPHGRRPGSGGHVNLLASIEQTPGNASNTFHDLPDTVGGGAARNAIPPYAIASFGVTKHIVQDLPVRTSSIRGLGAQMNVVCIEAAMDTLAASCGKDPLEFRLEHIEDSRGREMLRCLRKTLESEPTPSSEDEAIGISYSRYKGKAAYAAVAIRVQLTEKVKLLDVWAIVDAGRIVDRSGALNQIEGGIIQAASWTLCEGALLRNGCVDVVGWDDYPILSWADVPRIRTTLLGADDELPSLGVGECMVGPVSAAIVNGVSKLAGVTMADLPLNREKFIMAAAE